MSGWLCAGVAYGCLLALVGVAVARHLKRVSQHYRRPGDRP